MNPAFRNLPADLAAQAQALADLGFDIPTILKIVAELGTEAGPVLADITTLMSGSFNVITILDIWNRCSPIAAEIFAQLASHQKAAA
jgi:hypothetical protein